MRRFAAVPFVILLASCSGGSNAAPDLPQSVTPAWTRRSMVKTTDQCWKAEYASTGSAVVDVCRYSSGALALDAAQHAHTEANAVNFQQGNAFVVVKWSGASQTEITALVRAVQKSLNAN